jgi:AcrR family transcriptional regulator
MGRRRAFTHDQIGAAALVVVDRDGLAELSMRTVAAELGTGAMTLYNYVEDRAGLEALVVDAVSATIRLPSTARTGGWAERVVGIGLAIAATVRAHPEVAPLVLTRRSTAPAALRPAEALIGALRESGLDGQELLIAFRTVLGSVMGVIQAEVAGPVARRRGETRADVLSRFAELDANEFPNLKALSSAARTSSLTAEMTGALQLVVAGIECAATRST